MPGMFGAGKLVSNTTEKRNVEIGICALYRKTRNIVACGIIGYR